MRGRSGRNRMRIVHLYDGHERVRGEGSVPEVVWNLARRMAARGHEVTVLERQWRGTTARSVHEGVVFRRLDLSTGSSEPYDQIPYEQVQTIPGALRLVIDRVNFARAAWSHVDGFDVIHAHLPFAANVLATLSSSVARRLVYTAHLGETRKRVVEPIVSPDAWLAKRAARTVTLNPTMQRAFIERGVPAGRLTVIPNGVDLARFADTDEPTRDRVRAAYDLESPIVLFVGTVTPRKRVQDLIDAAARVLPDQDAHLVVVGNLTLDSAYVESVRASVPSTIAGRVTFTGFVPEEELTALYALADIFVLPSAEEGSSIAVTEALAAGLPVVATDIPGIAQQVEHGTHGFLFPVGDTDRLGSHLACLLDDPGERARLADAVEEHATTLSWDRTVERYLAVYRDIAGEPDGNH